MKAISLWQPWASLIAIGVKSIETRSWSTRYRGPLAIHAAKRKPDVEMMEDGPAGEIWGPTDCLVQWGETIKDDFRPPAPPPEDRWWLTLAPDHLVMPMPLGRVVAMCELVDVVPTQTLSWTELSSITERWLRMDGRVHVNEGQRPYGDFAPGRFAWLLKTVVPFGEPEPAVGHQGLWEWTP